MNKSLPATDSKYGAAVRGAGEWAAANLGGGGLRGAPVLESLIREGARLKSDIETKTARLRRINLALCESAEFKEDLRTAHLAGAGYQVTVRLHDNVTWDQERICEFRGMLSEEKFAQLFKAEYVPTSKKQIDGFMAHADPDLAAGLRSCMNIRPAAPQVVYEKAK